MSQKLNTFQASLPRTDFNQRHFGKIGIFFGGTSHERAISLRSGKAVFGALRMAGLDVVLIDTARPFNYFLKKNPIDLAFIALHGEGGEDGAIQKVLTRLHIPFVGSDASPSLSAFDKVRAKKIFTRDGIPTPAYQVVTRANWKKAIQKWKPPYVVKPIREGSSIGVFFVEKPSGAHKKVKTSVACYGQVIFEKKIEGREFTVGILGDETLPVIELRPKRKFYDYTAKYTKGLTEYMVPAPISKDKSAQLQSIAWQAHQALGLRDLSRVDLMMDQEGKPFVLEVNSIPGFTETSLLPKAAGQIGLDFTALCLRLIELAQVRAKGTANVYA